MDQCEENKGHPSVDPRENEVAGDDNAGARPTGNEEQEPAHFTNPYARASQARVMGKRPQPLDRENNKDEPDDSMRAATAAPAKPISFHGKCKSPVTSEKREPVLSNNDKEERGATNASPLMSTQEVAVFLHVSVSTIQRARKRKSDFPKPIRDGGSNFWVRTEIDAYLERLKARR